MMGQLAGIITKSDIFRVLISLTGEKTKGIVVALLLEDRPGSIKEVIDIIRNHGGRLVSILSTYEKVFQKAIERSIFECMGSNVLRS